MKDILGLGLSQEFKFILPNLGIKDIMETQKRHCICVFVLMINPDRRNNCPTC